MRDRISLPGNWWVSVSEKDARMAAGRKYWKTADLELAGDPENHPQKIDLPGGWQYGKRPLEGSDSTVAGVPTGEPILSEGPGERLPAHFLSYARRVRVPSSWSGKTCFLHINKARYHVTVMVNGETAAHYVGGLEPHRFDITALLRAGEENEIVMTIGDVGVSGHRKFDPHRFTGKRLPACEEIKDNLVHPVAYGGIDGRAVDQVTLEAVPSIRVEYVFANPKVSAGHLCYTVALANDTSRPAEVRVRSEARPSPHNLTALIKPGKVPSKQLLDRTLTLEARTLQKIQVEVPWADARLWDTDDPFLYELCTTLATSDPTTSARRLDTHRDDFGFREFTINGHNFLLNGRKIHLFGQSGHIGPAQEGMSLEEKIEFFRIAKEEGHVNHVRLHARPKDPRWVEAADRVGMLITTETALWTTAFYSFDWVGSERACYENIRQHFFDGLVFRDRNSPSVVIWSLSNEMSPITPWDLTDPKVGPGMSAMTRVFLRLISEASAEDDSRIIQMSSAMDFLGHLGMYNLHYPKNWQAYPDYPHTAYWLDGAFKFRWYGAGYAHMPAWSWRKDKPLYFGEYSCIYGPTPDSQSCLIGEKAFEDADFGSEKAQEKIWGMEAQAYRRQDVSGFCGWAFLMGEDTDVRKLIAAPSAAAYVRAIRPVAVLDHSFHKDVLEGEEIAFPLSVHNDRRHPLRLSLRFEVMHCGARIAMEQMPARTFEAGESLAFTHRFLAPQVEGRTEIECHATLLHDDQVLDRWVHSMGVWPRQVKADLPDDFAVFDPDNLLAESLTARGISCGGILRELHAEDLNGVRSLWLSFSEGCANLCDWREIRDALDVFVQRGGCVILDHPLAAVLSDLPVTLRHTKGFAEGDRLEITSAYPVAPFHPVLKPFVESDFSHWSHDYYVARTCVDLPQDGNAVALLVAGTDTGGLRSSPLMELRHGRGCYLVSTLDIFRKLREAPIAGKLLMSLADYRPGWGSPSSAVSLDEEGFQRLLEVGFNGRNVGIAEALAADVSVIDGGLLSASNFEAIRAALSAGRKVCLHGLGITQSTEILDFFQLPGEVLSGKAQAGEWDWLRHSHALADGLTNHSLYWIVDKSKVAVWTAAPTHPEPATALIRLPDGTLGASSLTHRGAVTVYEMGPGTLVIDNLRWHLTDFDEPERPRCYIRALLTNLGIPLLTGGEKVKDQSFETEAERRERGHF